MSITTKTIYDLVPPIFEGSFPAPRTGPEPDGYRHRFETVDDLVRHVALQVFVGRASIHDILFLHDRDSRHPYHVAASTIIRQARQERVVWNAHVSHMRLNAHGGALMPAALADTLFVDAKVVDLSKAENYALYLQLKEEKALDRKKAAELCAKALSASTHGVVRLEDLGVIILDDRIIRDEE